MGIYSDFTTFFLLIYLKIVFARYLPITPALPVISETCPLPLDYYKYSHIILVVDIISHRHKQQSWQDKITISCHIYIKQFFLVVLSTLHGTPFSLQMLPIRRFWFSSAVWPSARHCWVWRCCNLPTWKVRVTHLPRFKKFLDLFSILMRWSIIWSTLIKFL